MNSDCSWRAQIQQDGVLGSRLRRVVGQRRGSRAGPRARAGRGGQAAHPGRGADCRRATAAALVRPGPACHPRRPCGPVPAPAASSELLQLVCFCACGQQRRAARCAIAKARHRTLRVVPGGSRQAARSHARSCRLLLPGRPSGLSPPRFRTPVRGPCRDRSCHGHTATRNYCRSWVYDSRDSHRICAGAYF